MADLLLEYEDMIHEPQRDDIFEFEEEAWPNDYTCIYEDDNLPLCMKTIQAIRRLEFVRGHERTSVKVEVDMDISYEMLTMMASRGQDPVNWIYENYLQKPLNEAQADKIDEMSMDGWYPMYKYTYERR
jgi:hypothetical protein